jgi:hypothetical protein
MFFNNVAGVCFDRDGSEGQPLTSQAFVDPLKKFPYVPSDGEVALEVGDLPSKVQY